MCEPTTIAAVVLIAGASVSAYSTYQTGRAEARAAESNERMANLAAVDASRRGAIEEQEHRNRVRAMLGAQRAAFGAGNVLSSSGTPLGLIAQTAQFGETDALTIRNNAAREAFGYRVQASDARDRASAARRAGTLGATGTALTSGAQAYGFWRGQKNPPKKKTG